MFAFLARLGIMGVLYYILFSMLANYAFIDAQNLNSGLLKLGWKIDWKRFREYLRTVKNIEVAYVFIGFML